MATLKFKDESGEWITVLGGGGSGGYGLGNKAILLTSNNDLNKIMKNGWYYWRTNDAPANIPTDDGTRYMTAMRVWTDDGTTFCQELIDMTDDTTQGCMMRRTAYDSETVFPWEWVNPPMEHNVEYRTTERHEGKPVYVKRYSVPLDFIGTAYNHAIGAVASKVISLSGTVISDTLTTTFPFFDDTASLMAYAYVNGSGTLILQVMEDLNGYTAEFIIKYVKD